MTTSAGMVGAELKTLRDLHKTLDSHAQEALQFKRTISSAVDNAVWKGANATKFRNAWEGYKKTFTNLHNDLSQAATDVKHQHNNIAAANGEPDRI